MKPNFPSSVSTLPRVLFPFRSLLCLALALLLTSPAWAGGSLVVNDFTNSATTPGPVPGSQAVDKAPLHWDVRCLPVEYRLNTAVTPNASPPLDAAQTRAVIAAALDAWNSIPTSYVDLQIGDSPHARERTEPFGFLSFDFIPEFNFLANAQDPFGAISPSTSLPEDTQLTPGMDLDGDGDSDVFDPAIEGIEVCSDVDGDGDFDVPAGFYDAGTILDNDVALNNAIVWTTGPPNAIFGQFDMQGILTHEIGHSFGLAHTALDWRSPTDGTPSVMNTFGAAPFDIPGQLALRVPAAEEVGWASFLYPEGTASSGPAALQPGDVAFDEVYGLITGVVTHGRTGLPLVGSQIRAVDQDTGAVVSSQTTGTIRLLSIPDENFLGVLPEEADFHLVDGRYTLPVPEGDYHLVIEALDGSPLPTNFLDPIATPSGAFGLNDHDEEIFLKPGKNEQEPLEVEVEAGETVAGIDHTTLDSVRIEPFDRVGLNIIFDLDVIGFFGAPPGRLYAVEFPAAEIEALLDAGLEPTGGGIRSFLFEVSSWGDFVRADLVTGTVDENGATLDLDDPIASSERVPGFSLLSAENDDVPLLWDEPGDVAEDLAEAIEEDGVESFFLVAELPSDFSTLFGFPLFVGFDRGQVAGVLNRSYFSDDGGANFAPVPGLNAMFHLTFN